MLEDWTDKQKESLIVGGTIAAITAVATGVVQDGMVVAAGATVLAAQQLAYAHHFPNEYRDDDDNQGHNDGSKK